MLSTELSRMALGLPPEDKLAFLFAFGQFRSMLSYFSLPDARGLFWLVPEHR
jgi:hypothetical protein